MSHGTYAVITSRDRHLIVPGAVGSIAGQVDRVLVIDHRSDPPLRVEEFWPGDRVTVERREDDPVNLSKLWNYGLEWAHDTAVTNGDHTWDVVVMNDDARVPLDWVKQLSTEMRATTAVLASSCDNVRIPTLQSRPDRDILRRLQGWAWMIRGERNLRLDERFVWWFGDTDLDWRARTLGGTMLVPTEPVQNLDANGYTNRVGELSLQAGRDRETFKQVWGWVPW